MRGAGAAGRPAVTVRSNGRDDADLVSLREELLRLETQVQELRARLDSYELPQDAPAEARKAPRTAAAESLNPASDYVTDILGFGFNLAGITALALCIGFVVRQSSGRGAGASLAVVIGGTACLALLARMFRRSRSGASSGERTACWFEGAAVGVAYLAAYSTFGLTHSLAAAFAVAALITVAAIALALARRSQSIAIFAVWGGLLTPLLMGGSGPAADPASGLLFAYLALINVSTLVVSRYRYWPAQAASSLLATHFLAWMWYADHHGGSRTLTLLFPFITFVVFLVRPVVSARSAAWWDKAIAVLNSLFFLAALQTLLEAPLLPFAPGALGLVHATTALLMPAGLGLAATHVAMTVLLLAPGSVMAAPALAPLVWSAMATGLVLLGIRHGHWGARMAGYCLFAAAIPLAPRAYVVVPLMMVVPRLLRHAWKTIPETGDVEWLMRGLLPAAVLLGGLAASALETRALLSLPVLAAWQPNAQFFYSLSIACYAAALLLWARLRASLLHRVCGLIIFALLTGKVFLIDLPVLAGTWRIGSLFLLAGSLLLATQSLRKRSAGGAAVM